MSDQISLANITFTENGQVNVAQLNALLQRSRYVSVTLTDGSGIAGFYQRFGFEVFDKDVSRKWERKEVMGIQPD